MQWKMHRRLHPRSLFADAQTLRIASLVADDFLDMLEDYFAQPDASKAADCHPELHYQVGLTPELVEVPLCQVRPSHMCTGHAVALM